MEAPPLALSLVEVKVRLEGLVVDMKVNLVEVLEVDLVEDMVWW